MHAAMRAACVQLLTDYKADASIKLQIYPARPRSVAPPTAFVDAIGGEIEYLGPTLRQFKPRAEVVLIHGLFDSAEAADQKDAFVDGFCDWVNERFHAAGANTLIAVVDTMDEPNYIPDWLPPDEQRSFYATRLTLEGLALS